MVAAVVAPAFAGVAAAGAAASAAGVVADAAAVAVPTAAEKVVAVDHTEAEGLESVYAVRFVGCLHDMALGSPAARMESGPVDSDLDQACSETVAGRTADALLEALETVVFLL